MSETHSRQGGARVRFPPPLVFALAIAVGWFLPPRLAIPLAARLALAAVLLAGSAAIVLAARRLFIKTGQDPKPWQPTPELIFAGPYRFTRNPMYVGMTLLTSSIGVAAGRGAVLLLAPAALLVVHFIAVLPEERYLAEKFGEPYLQYKSRVRRYL